MNPAYKMRSSNEALDEHLKLQRRSTTLLSVGGAADAGGLEITTATIKANRKHIVAPKPPIVPIPPAPPVPPSDLPRMRSDSTATSIYVMGADTCATNGTTATGDTNQAIDRKQRSRRSWLNMRRSGERQTQLLNQQHRSYITTMGVGDTEIGGSGRTTAASGRISTSGATTISGSNNTLNDIISDYHSHEAGSSDYHYSGASTNTPTRNISSNNSFNIANGSTVKLLPITDDMSNQQTKCSIIRGLILCVCLNISYANIVRFPREVDKYGLAYLVPYVVLLFFVGLPMLLLEVSLGQFLGQGAMHMWRASPIFKGACIISRFASWLSTIWMSLQAVMALAYIGMFLMKSLPFADCAGDVKLALSGYIVVGNSGQECILRTFLTPFWENPFYYGLLSTGLVFLWLIVMLSTNSSKFLRRSLFCLGVLGFGLLCALTGWEVNNSFARSYFPELWPFEIELLQGSNIWFNALMQVLFATNCGFGILPTLTGKFLYKGDAVRTGIVFLCFNLMINAIAVTLFMVQFDASANIGTIIEELKPLTVIYDRFLYDRLYNNILSQALPVLLYALVVISALMSICIALYTTARLVPRRPNLVIGLLSLVASVICFAAPKFLIARILDTRVVGALVVTAAVFELIAVTWIYGPKNVYTDLEFSIGRPICKGWMVLWVISPAILTGLLVWWCSDDDQYDFFAEYVPRWAPILIALIVIFIIACVQIFRQVEYNFFDMICEASKPAKEWGPADPLARHAWKQWRSVCQDTGRRDFTLRRRGTRDYTHSAKKGQYSTSNKNTSIPTTTLHWKSSSPGNSSPNYSGSMFGDSAIEEDISVDKFPGVQNQNVPFQNNEGRLTRYSHRAPAPPSQLNHHSNSVAQNHVNNERAPRTIAVEKHREVVYIRRVSNDSGKHATRIEITPSNESITYADIRNPLAKAKEPHVNSVTYLKQTNSSNEDINNRNSIVAGKYEPPMPNDLDEHICWRQFSVKPAECSTEL